MEAKQETLMYCIRFNGPRMIDELQTVLGNQMWMTYDICMHVHPRLDILYDPYICFLTILPSFHPSILFIQSKRANSSTTTVYREKQISYSKTLPEKATK